MEKKKRLIGFLGCMSAIGILVGIYSAARIQGTTHVIIMIVSFTVAAVSLISTAMIFKNHYKK